MADDPTQRFEIERAIARVLREERMSRRAFLRRTGQAGITIGAAMTLPAILAACGPGGNPNQLNWANWPAYIDIDENGKYPTIEKFTAETGIKVTYTEDINDNEEFFNKLLPDLSAGNAINYDLIVLTDWTIERMVRLGYLEKLDASKLPTAAANVQDLYKSPWYDPGNVYSYAWQSGFTGIGYNKKLTGRPITTFDDLLDPAFKGTVGMFSEMRDTLSLALLSLGVKPEDATIADVNRAKDKLLAAAKDGQFRNFYGNDYYDELANGNLALTMAWSGDVAQMKLYDNADVEFVIPDTGAMLFTDNMCIPKKAANIEGAHKLIDFWFKLENAVPLTEYIGYFSPVKGVSEAVKADADAAAAEGDQETADQLNVVSETAFPTEAQLAKSYHYKILTEDEEAQWNAAFNEVVAG